MQMSTTKQYEVNPNDEVGQELGKSPINSL